MRVVTGDFRCHFPDSHQGALIASLLTPRATLVVDEDRSCHDRGHGFGFSLSNIPFITYLYIIQQVYTPGNPCLIHPVIPPDTSQSATVDYRLSTISLHRDPFPRTRDGRRTT